MLRSLKDLERYTVSATDGDVGNVENFLLDDESWVIRYLVASTGGFLDGREVLLSPLAIKQADWATHRFQLRLTQDRIRNSPGIDADQPVSRQHERDYFNYYGYPTYWGSSGIWGMAGAPSMIAPGLLEQGQDHLVRESDDIHLRSFKEVCGYHIQGSDDVIGHVDDFIVDDETWAVRYLVIDTSNWWLGKKVLVSPLWADSISWEDKKVYLDRSRAEIKASPEWDPNACINRKYEANLYDYYGRPAYWAAGSARDTDAHPAQTL
jgi:hypothetical protein